MASDGFVSSLRFDGWVPLLSRQWSVSPEDERCLLGYLELSYPIAVTADRPREVYRAFLRLQPAASTPAVASSHDDEDAVLFRRVEGALFFVEVDSADERLSVELSANIPAKEFDAVWEQATRPHALWLRAEMVGATGSKPLELTGKSVTKRVAILSLSVQAGDAAPTGWAQSRQADALKDALSNLHFEAGWGNQVQLAVRELAESAALNGLDAASYRACCEAVRALIGDVRTAFKAPLKLTPGSEQNSLYLGPSEFAKAVAGRGADEAKKLQSSYDMLWEHFNVADVVRQGEANAGATPKGFRPEVAELEGVAARLLSNRRMHSAFLEWALVDALIYAECIAFAQVVVSGQTVLGFKVAGELKGFSPMKVAGKDLAKSAGLAALELAKVALTFIVAHVLAAENAQTAWVITTGVTAARWVRLAVLQKGATPARAQTTLLAQMANVHELLKSRQFNARLLRKELYRVAAEGAVFSPWVFHILDARIRREG